jgi:hypothetical protein
MRVSLEMLKNKIDYLNQITNSPSKPYSVIDGKHKANIGNFHLYQAYGAYGLHRMVNEGGGVSDSYIYGLHSKKELKEKLSAFIQGIEFNNEV